MLHGTNIICTYLYLYVLFVQPIFFFFFVFFEKHFIFFLQNAKLYQAKQRRVTAGYTKKSAEKDLNARGYDSAE